MNDTHTDFVEITEVKWATYAVLAGLVIVLATGVGTIAYWTVRAIRVLL
jgi:hypothetical protein